MNCEQAEELLGAYAVDALPDDEAARFREHIATCVDHAARAGEMRAAASQLAEAGRARRPARRPARSRPQRHRPRAPTHRRTCRTRALTRHQCGTAVPGCRSRTRAPACHRCGTAVPGCRCRTAPSRVTDVPQPPSAANAGRVRLPFERVRPTYAWGALAAAVIAGLLAWNIVLQTGGQSDAERYAIANADAVEPLLAGDLTVGSVLIFEDEGKAAVIADRIPELEDTQTYQMWSIRRWRAVEHRPHGSRRRRPRPRHRALRHINRRHLRHHRRARRRQRSTNLGSGLHRHHQPLTQQWSAGARACDSRDARTAAHPKPKQTRVGEPP